MQSIQNGCGFSICNAVGIKHFGAPIADCVRTASSAGTFRMSTVVWAECTSATWVALFDSTILLVANPLNTLNVIRWSRFCAIRQGVFGKPACRARKATASLSTSACSISHLRPEKAPDSSEPALDKSRKTVLVLEVFRVKLNSSSASRHRRTVYPCLRGSDDFPLAHLRRSPAQHAVSFPVGLDGISWGCNAIKRTSCPLV